MECIKSQNGDIIAIVIKNNIRPKGVKFFTPSDFSQQVGLLKHKVGAVVKPHVHNIIKRKVERTQEVLYIKEGKVVLYLYDNDKKKIATRTLKEGDTAILASAGHGLKVIEESLILEIKQGPYAGEMDKEYI
jgi:cupin fold WbuC family metalloprotein